MRNYGNKIFVSFFFLVGLYIGCNIWETLFLNILTYACDTQRKLNIWKDEVMSLKNVRGYSCVMS